MRELRHQRRPRLIIDVDRTPLLDPYASADNVQRAEEVLRAPEARPRRPVPDEAGVSVVILTLDRPEYIIPLLDHLQAQQLKAETAGLRIELIVGDTGSTDRDVLRYYSDNRARVTVVRDLAYHFAGCNNRLAFDHASCRALLFLNNDIVFPPDSQSILEMYRQLESDPAIGAVGAWLFFPDGSVQHGGVDFSRRLDIRGFCYHPCARAKMDPRNLRRVDVCPAVTGACMMTRSELFWRLGGMDEGYHVECQDIAYCLALDRLGFCTVVLNAGNVLHLENGTRPRGQEEWPDRQRFLRKWGAYIEVRFL
jgi:GT2 family glycosyltransferase